MLDVGACLILYQLELLGAKFTDKFARFRVIAVYSCSSNLDLVSPINLFG